MEYTLQSDELSPSSQTFEKSTQNVLQHAILEELVQFAVEDENDTTIELEQSNESIEDEGATEAESISGEVEDLAIEDDTLDEQKFKSNTSKKKVKVAKKGKKKAAAKKRKKVNSESDEKSKKVRLRRSRRKVTYYAQPSLSYILPISSLNLRDAELNNALQILKDTETQLEAFGVGFNVYRQSRNGFIIVAGIEYQRLNRRVNLVNETEQVEIRQGVVTITEDSQGQIIDQELGPKEIVRRTIEEQRIYNHHIFVNIPVGVGKVWENRKYDFKLLGGLDFNIYHNFKGTIKDTNRDISILRRTSDSYERVFNKKTGVGIWLSSEFAKPINEKTLLWIAPRIQIPFSDVNLSEYALKQKYFNFNLSIGVSLMLK